MIKYITGTYIFIYIYICSIFIKYNVVINIVYFKCIMWYSLHKVVICLLIQSNLIVDWSKSHAIMIYPHIYLLKEHTLNYQWDFEYASDIW